jgi:hypothetical protein
MGVTEGVVLIVIAFFMVWFGRGKKDGDIRYEFMRYWLLFTGYTMVCMICFIMGIAMIIGVA